MSRFSDWLNEKYIAWEKAQGTTQTYMKFASYLCVDPNVIINIMLEKALPDAGDLMAIAAMEGMVAYDMMGKDRPEDDVVEVFSLLGPMPTDFRMRMAFAIHEAEKEMKQKNISSGSEESKQIYIRAFDRWGFHYNGEVKIPKRK